MYFTYIIRCKDESFYTGYTSNVERRMEEHKRGVNSKYTKAKGFERLEVYFVTYTRSNAMKLESYIKKQSRKKKKFIIENPELFIKELENSHYYTVGEFIKSQSS